VAGVVAGAADVVVNTGPGWQNRAAKQNRERVRQLDAREASMPTREGGRR